MTRKMMMIRQGRPSWEELGCTMLWGIESKAERAENELRAVV